MSRATIWLAIGTALVASCFPPGASGPGFRLAPESIRGPAWSEHISKVHATLTVVDEFHGTRVYVVHLPEGRTTETYLPFVSALDACSIPGGDVAYVLLTDGRIVRTTDDLESNPAFKLDGSVKRGASIALSPDGSTIALLHQPPNPDSSNQEPFRLTLIDVASGHTSDLRGELGGSRPCWAADGTSLFLCESSGAVVQCSLVPGEPARRIGDGRAPLLCEDGRSLLFLPRSVPPSEWTGVTWRTWWAYMRWTVGSTETPERLPDWIHAGGCVIAFGADGLIVLQSEPDQRLPLEHSGLFMTAPHWRGGISAFDPAKGTNEPLFVGIIPVSIQWRWD